MKGVAAEWHSSSSCGETTNRIDREKVRRSAGIFFFVGLGNGYFWHPMLRQTMANGDRSQAQHHRQSDICQSPAPCVGADQIEGLEAEGGEGGESAADPHHDKEADVIGGRVSAAVQREGAEVADNEAAEHVDEHRADAKANTDTEGREQPGDG